MGISEPIPNDALLESAEEAALFGVDPKTVARWARAGKLASIHTPDGHRRYYANEVLALMNQTVTRRTR